MASSEKIVNSILASSDGDGEIAQHLYRLSRKNHTAKLKALAALSQLIKQKPAEEIVKMIHQWAFIYRKLVQDYKKEVRLAAHGTMKDLVIALPFVFDSFKQPVYHILFNELIGPWWVSQFDLVHQVSQVAKSSFETAFPTPDRKLLVLSLCTTEIFAYIDENLKRTPRSLSSLSGVANATERLEQMHQQVLSSSLLALAALLDVLPFQNSAKSTSSESVDLMPADKDGIEAVSTVEKLFTSHEYFTGFFKSQSPVVRTAAYSVVKSCIKHSISHAFDKREVMKVVFPAILGCFQETDPTCHSSMWEALLVFMKTYPESWSTVNFQKALLNPLWDFLKNGCFGSQQVSYPALVTFLNTLPPQNSITGDKFFVEFFHNLWAGRMLSCSDAADQLAFFLAIKECFVWALRNAYRYCDGVDAILRFKRLLVVEILIGLLWHEYHKIVSSAYDPSHEVQPTHTRDFEECIIKILSQLQHDLLMVVSLKLKADCSETLRLKKYKNSQEVHWIVRFFLLLDKHAVQKGETWPFDLVRPTLQSIQEFDSSPDSGQLLEVAVSVFGPRKILCEIACSSDSGNEDLPCASVNEIVVPWCLQEFSDYKMDLLLAALLDNEESSFLEEWDVVINYIVNSVTACSINNESAVEDKDQFYVFASLMNKARKINRRQTSKCHYHILDLMKKAWEMTTRWKFGSATQSIIVKWHHDRLDSVAVLLVFAGPPYKKSNAQFISAVLGGGLEDDKSFLSPCTQILILEEVLRKLLLFMMDSTFVWVRDLCSLLANNTSYSGWETEESCCNNSPDMACFALDILSGSIFCLKNIEDGNEELIEGVLTAIFIIDWEFNLNSMLGDELNEERLEKVNSRLASGEAAHAFCYRVSDQLLKGFDANRRKSLGTKLIELAKHVFVENDDAFVSDKFISTSCKWILDIFQVLCVDRLEQQQLLNQLLSKNECWSTADCELSGTENVHPQEGFKNSNFMAVIEKLIPKLGFDELVARPWLVSEFLCTWKWIGGSALGSFLPSLIGYMNDKDDSSEFFNPIINVLLDGSIAHQGVDKHNRGLNHLFWLVSFEEIGTVEEPFLRALLALLSTLFRDKIWGKEKALSLFEQLVNLLHIDDTNVNLNCLSILPFVMNILVDTQFLNEYTPFHNLTVDWLERSISFPPLNAWETGEGMEDWFKLIIACFPIRVMERMQRKVDDKMKLLLYKLFQKQNVACSPLSVNLNEILPSQLRQILLLSKLMVISVAYCREHLDEDGLIFILSSSKDWIQSAVDIIEEIAESSMNNSVVDAAALSSKLMNNVVISDCLTIALNALVVFSLPCNFVKLHMEENSGEARSLVIDRKEFGTDEVLEKILRLLISSAATEESAVSDCHEEASTVINFFRFEHRRLWELVGSFVDKTTSRIREGAEKSMLKKLRLSKEPISSLYALLFSCKPLPSLQSAAFELLSTAPLVCSALTFDIDNNNPSSSADEKVFGMREEISCILQKSPQVYQMDLLAHERVNVLVAWAMVLTRLTSLSSNSSVVARQRAIQGVKNLMDPYVVLDCLFQHIPVEKCVGTSSTTKYRKLGSEVSIAGSAAKRAIKEGSALFAIKYLWPVVVHDSMASLSGAVFGLMLCNFPAYVRRWWYYDVQDPCLADAYELFIMSWCSKVLASYESSQMKCGNLSISKETTAFNNEVVTTATYIKDDGVMELKILFPLNYPLCRPTFYYGYENVGIDKQKKDDWLNSLRSYKYNQNGTLEEEIRLWKSNIDKEFEEVEDCSICYLYIIGKGNKRLPDVGCSTCKHKFHRKCITKWLSTDPYPFRRIHNRRKNTCPLCKSSFYPVAQDTTSCC